jgi:hypothetical protein
MGAKLKQQTRGVEEREEQEDKLFLGTFTGATISILIIFNVVGSNGVKHHGRLLSCSSGYRI